MNKPPLPEIDELLQGLLDDQLQPEELEHLQKAIQDNPRVREYYIDSMLVTAVTRRSSHVTRELAHPELLPTHSTTQIKSLTNRFKKYRTAIAACLMLALVITASISFIKHKVLGPSIGILAGDYEPQWHSLHPHSGDKIYAQSYELTEGAAKIQLDQGVTLLLEAPCQIEIKNPNEILLNNGRLVANVSPSATGFQVHTPTSAITDLGTEFGVITYSDGSSEAHVLKGKIQVDIDPEKAVQSSSQTFSQGQAAYVDASGQAIHPGLTATPDQFLLELPQAFQSNSHISLADIVGGGNGDGTGTIDQGINLGSGQWFNRPPKAINTAQNNNYLITSHIAGVDGVFVPNRALCPVQITSTGLTFKECPQTLGSYYGGPTNSGKFFDILSQHTYNARLNGITYGTATHPGLVLHPNAGITFDLNQIRQNNPDIQIEQFTALCGIPKEMPYYQFNTVDVWILLDGSVASHLQFPPNRKSVETITIPIPTQTQFLTLVTTCTDRADYSWLLLGNPILESK